MIVRGLGTVIYHVADRVKTCTVGIAGARQAVEESIECGKRS
jgi:hypothetical protein